MVHNSGSRNPFTPSFGSVPARLAGRRNILADIGEAFDNGPGDPNLSSILVGARGTGKTALLACIADEASQRGWVVASTTAVGGMLQDVLEQATRASGHIVSTEEAARITGFNIAQMVGIDLERPIPERGNWRTRMTQLLDALAEQGIGLLITVDEVRSDIDEMVQLAAVYQHFVQEGRKVALVMAGLPYHASSLVGDKSVSFLRRSRQHQLGRIPDVDVRDALRQTVQDGGRQISDDALDKAVESVSGFAFMIQLVGYWTWRQSDSPIIGVEDVGRGIDLARRELDESMFDATYRELSKVDIAFLTAMLELGGKCTLAEVSEKMGKPSNYTTKYKERLQKQGIIGDRGHNNLEIDLPGFLEYLQMRM